MNPLTAEVKDAEITLHHDLKVADAVWIATALLQRRAGLEDRDRGFETEVIVNAVQTLGLTRAAEKSIWQHVNQHCVANRKPNPNRSRMLFALGGAVRRLYRDTDRNDPGRDGAPTHPKWENLPPKYSDLQHWYEQEWNVPLRGIGSGQELEDPLLALIGSGKSLWQDEHADEHVAGLRQNWGDAR